MDQRNGINTCFYCGKAAESGLCENWKVERRENLNRIKQGHKIQVADYTHRGDKREF